MNWTRVPRAKALIAILWPSFLVAGAFTGLLFAFVDPWVLMDEVGVDSTSRLAGYSMAFIYFWIAGIIAAFFTMYILCTPEPGAGRGHPHEAHPPREPRL